MHVDFSKIACSLGTFLGCRQTERLVDLFSPKSENFEQVSLIYFFRLDSQGAAETSIPLHRVPQDLPHGGVVGVHVQDVLGRGGVQRLRPQTTPTALAERAGRACGHKEEGRGKVQESCESTVRLERSRES